MDRKKREKLVWEFWAVKKGGITDLGIVTGKRGRNQFGNCGQQKRGSSRFGGDLGFPNRNFSQKMGIRAQGRKWEEGARNHRILLAGKALEYHPAQPWKNCGEQRGWILPHLGNEEQLPGGFPSKRIFPHGVPSPAPQYPHPNPSLPSTWSCLESKQFPVPPSHMSAAPPGIPSQTIPGSRPLAAQE